MKLWAAIASGTGLAERAEWLPEGGWQELVAGARAIMVKGWK